jgi:hypothetical protein
MAFEVPAEQGTTMLNPRTESGVSLRTAASMAPGIARCIALGSFTCALVRNARKIAGMEADRREIELEPIGDGWGATRHAVTTLRQMSASRTTLSGARTQSGFPASPHRLEDARDATPRFLPCPRLRVEPS